MGPTSKEHKSSKIDSLRIVIGTDRKFKMPCAHVVPSKGLDQHAVKMAGRDIRLSKYSKIILKSDQEFYWRRSR